MSEIVRVGNSAYDRGNMTTLSLWLLCAALLLILVWLIPPAPDCWLPADAPVIGLYDDCWGFWELWT